LIPICISLGKWDETEDFLTRMESIEERSLKSHFSEELRDRILLQSSLGRLALYSRTGNLDEGLELIEFLEEKKETLELYHRKYVLLHLHFNIAYFLFTVGQYSPAIRWLNSILNDTDLKTVEDLHSSTRILTMILQFELGRNELLEYLARSTYRFLNKLDGLYGFEEVMLSFMKKVSKNDVFKENPDAFQKLRTDLIEAGYEPGERNALSTIDLVAWVDAKLEGKMVYEVLKEKHSV
jgi:tetratricopeptide (TPR) repeat protein